MARRTDFTDGDDEHLIKYIAREKPAGSGRLGNNLYINLVDSADRRPWATRHSWQSWRERYKKNQEWFDYKIKKHQKKLRAGGTDKGEVQTTQKKTEPKSTVNGDNKLKVDKGTSGSNVKKLIQTKAQVDKPEKEKLIKQISSIPPPSSEAGDEDLYRELFGVSQFSEDNEDEPLDTHEKSLVPSSSNVKQDNIYPSIESAPQPRIVDKEVHIPGSFDGAMKIEPTTILSPAREPVHNPELSSVRKSKINTTSTTDTLPLPQPPRDKLRTKVLPRDDDSNFFGTPSQSQSPSPSPLANKSFADGNPPTFLEGPYRNCLKRPRATSEDVTNDVAWPPKRKKKTVEDSPGVEKSGKGDAHGGVEAKVAVPLTLSVNGNTNELRRRPPTPVNAVASSSKVLLPDPPQKHTKPTNLLKMIYAKGAPPPDINQDKTLPTSFIQTAANNGSKSMLTGAAPRLKVMKDTKPPFVVDNKKHDERTASPDPRSSKYIHRLIITPNNTDTVTHQPARISPVGADDPFIDNKPIDKEETGANSPTTNFILHGKPRRIDLRPSLKKDVMRRSSNLSSHSTRSSMSSTSRQFPTSFLLPEDQEMVNQVGFSEIMAVIAKHYGFDVDVATNAFFATRSIEKTKKVLQHAKEVANSATSVLLAELVDKTNGDDDVDSYDDEEPRSMRRGRSPSSRKDQSPIPGDQKTIGPSSGSRYAKRPSLNINIKPQLFDEVIEQNSQSDYSPPRVSRAGQYARLIKQGRRREAVDREQQRASGVFVAQTQIQSPGEKNHKSPSLSPMLNSSPTPNTGQEEPMIIDGCSSDDDDNDSDGDSFQQPVATVHEDTAQHQPPDNVPLPIDHHHRIVIKRLSEGQSTLNEEEDDPAVVKLAQEHRDLVMNVTEENADALRSFERKNNLDLLRLWSLDWMKQSIANI